MNEINNLRPDRRTGRVIDVSYPQRKHAIIGLRATHIRNNLIEPAVGESSGGDHGMDNEKYVTHRELDSAIGSLRNEVGLQFKNVNDKIDSNRRELISEMKLLLNDKFDEERKERKSDKHWIIGITITSTGVIVAIASLILGIVLHH